MVGFTLKLILIVTVFYVNLISQVIDVSELVPNDSGWIKVFRGNNDEDFFTLDRTTKGTYPNNVFGKMGDTLTASGAAPHHVVFKQNFSHYIIKYQQHFPANFGNAGMLLHVMPDDPYLFGSFPRSVESQGDPNQGMAQLWCISDVWVDVNARFDGNTPRYDPNASEITYGAESGGQRLITGINGYGQPNLTNQWNDDWIQFEAHVYGSDSILHHVGGELMIKYKNARVAPANDPNNVQKMLDHGMIAWQSEGVRVWYRNILIKLFPKDPLYDSVYGGCTDTTYEEYNPAAQVHKPSMCVTKLGCKTVGYVEYDPNADKHDDRFCVTGVIDLANQSFTPFLSSYNSESSGLVIKVYYPGKFNLEVQSVSGKTLQNFPGSKDKHEYRLTSIVESGVYLVQLKSQGKIINSQQLVIY